MMRRASLWLFLGSLFILTAQAQVTLTQEPGKIQIQIDGKEFSTFFFGPETAKPYLHPLRAADGTVVSRRYPMEEVPGESHDHPHHRGLWFTHGDVNGYDFWSADPSRSSEKFGRVVLRRIIEAKSGRQSGWLEAEFSWQAPDGKELLIERRRMVFYRHPTLRVIDVDITLTAVERCRFGDTKEGTFAVRVTDSMNESHGGVLVNAEGARGEKNVWGKRSPWADYYGQVDGRTVGIAIFDHPGNPKHPPFWHARAYGLFAVNIFGERDFYRDKNRDGSLTLEPGASWRFRYRVVIHPGDPESAGISRLYQEYVQGRAPVS